MNLRELDSASLSQQQHVCGVPGSQLRCSRVSFWWFEGLRVVDPWSRKRCFRFSQTVFQGLTFGCTESCTKRWAREAHFQKLRLAGAIARKWLSPARNVLIGDGRGGGVEPPPPRFRLLSLRHTPSMTLNLGGGTSFQTKLF
jgi:hypothetical protein